jgi:LEA14-like dessication related protein
LEKTIPLKMGIVTSLERVINDFAAPSITASVDLVEFTTEKISFKAIIDAYNPNSFEIYIEDIIGEITTETGIKIGEIDVISGILQPKESTEINTTGWMLLEAFNSEKILFKINGVTGVRIAGFDKNMTFNAETRLNLPDLEELVLSKDNPVLLSIKTKNKFSLRGVITEIYLETVNTYNVDLEMRGIICRLYTVKDDELNLLGENSIEESMITEAGQTSSTMCEIIIPYSKLLASAPSSDWLLVSVTGRMTIKGINPSVFVEIRGFTDIHLFR